MKIAILGSPETFESYKLQEEGQRRGHQIERIDFSDLVFLAGPKVKFLYKQKNLTNFDAAIFRGLTKHVSQALILAEYLFLAKKIVVDERLAKSRYIESKFSSLVKFSRAGLPIPASFQVNNFSRFKKIIKEIGFPAIVKKQMAAKGEGVFKIENFEEAQKIENYDLSQLIFQQYIPSNFDIRILVIGQKVLGGMKRTAKPGEFRSNVAQGGTVKKFSPTAELTKLAQKTSQVSGNDVSGVDIMIDDHDQPYVIECNRAPQFKAFQEITSINVAAEIIKYLEEKFEKKATL